MTVTICECSYYACAGSNWVLVHDGDKVIVAQKNTNQMTASQHTILEYDTETEMNAAIATLGLTPLPPEEEH